MNLKNKLVVITGAGSGIGAELALQLEKCGAHVIRTSRKKEGKVEYACDVADFAQVQTVAREIEEKYGAIDVWVNNAGVFLQADSIFDEDLDQVYAMYGVNVFGLMHGTRVAGKLMCERGQGTVVNIISTAALKVACGQASYGATKWAVEEYNAAARREFALKNVEVLAVYPGSTKTHLFDAKLPKNYDTFLEVEEVVARIVKNLQKKRPVARLKIAHNPKDKLRTLDVRA